MKLVAASNIGTQAYDFGEGDGPVLTAVELANVRGATGPTFNISNAAINRLLTSGTGGTSAVAQSNLTFNGSVLGVTGSLMLYGGMTGSSSAHFSTLQTIGDATIGGNVTIGTGSGNEGGELRLALAQSNTTLSTSVTVDIFQDRLRIFETGGNNRGAYLNISTLANSVGSELVTKASGFVNAGTDVTLGNLRARIPTTANYSLQVATVSGTYSVYGSCVGSASGNPIANTIEAGFAVNVTTTPAYLASGRSFLASGDSVTWLIMDTANTISWRINCIIGASFNSNMISIERIF
jgi:hypothetical protein